MYRIDLLRKKRENFFFTLGRWALRWCYPRAETAENWHPCCPSKKEDVYMSF